MSEKRILMLGLSFKPDTDDVRESVSLKLLQLLSGEVGIIYAHDPVALNNSTRLLKKESTIVFCENWKERLSDVDVVIVATSWDEYRDLIQMDEQLSGKYVFDTRSMMTESDFSNALYFSVN